MKIKLSLYLLITLIASPFTINANASFLASVNCGGPIAGGVLCDASPVDENDPESGVYSYHWLGTGGNVSLSNDCNEGPDGSFYCFVSCSSPSGRVQVTVIENATGFSDSNEETFACSSGGF